ncbi:threonine dehydratase [Prosthecomicrobium sp. N25]|uniref:threonine dehydratase n=1 Tax=Prosthecomicrobium sp. N25 TaxID=3129254 RepID=UPI0030784C8D
MTREDLEAARSVVYRRLAPTPQLAWPLLAEAAGTAVWAKHENHLMTGAFKARGGLVYVDRLRRERPHVRGIVSATRGNHGQSLAFATRGTGLSCTIVVPHGNSVEKNAAMRALGADLVEHGRDFDEARVRAAEIAAERGFEMVPSFHADLVRGVASYGLELFEAVPDLGVVYAPIGLGSGICGLAAARAALGVRAELVGVVSENAPAYKLSVEAGRVVPTNSAATFADGMAVRVPSEEALAIIRTEVARIVTVSDEEVAEAMRLLFRATHNVAEGAGAAALAALLKERTSLAGRPAAFVLSGGNVDTPWYRTVLEGGTPVPA